MRATLLLLLAVWSVPALGAEPTGWRTDATGQYPAARPAIRWSKTENVLWKVPLSAWSNATPVVAGDRLFLCAEPDELLCVGRDGKLLWRRRAPAGQSREPATHKANGYTSATPTSDGRRVYALFGTGQAVCYDLEGKLLWKRQLERPVHRWGHSASPTLAAGKLVVHLADTVSALDPATGRTLWSARSRQCWGTPVGLRVGETDLLALAGGDLLRASDGVKLASRVGKLVYATPVVSGDVVYYVGRRASAVALAPDGKGGVTARQLWSTSLRRSRYYASVVVHQGLIYALEQRNHLSVLDARSGEVVYQRRLSLGRGTCYPSLTLAGRLLLASNDNGTTLLFRPGREFEEVATNKLERFRASLIFDGSRMYVRAYRALYCIAPSAGAAAKPKPVKKKGEKVEFYEE